MSRKVETRMTEPKESEVTTEVRCDLCGKLAPHPGQCYPWEDAYEIYRPEISMMRGESYPEGGSSVNTFFDVCPECFVTKVIPAIQALGAEPITEETDW